MLIFTQNDTGIAVDGLHFPDPNPVCNPTHGLSFGPEGAPMGVAQARMGDRHCHGVGVGRDHRRNLSAAGGTTFAQEREKPKLLGTFKMIPRAESFYRPNLTKPKNGHNFTGF
ncbi:MAG: hypothetical protein SGJ18_03510 [Pseudomonadota bacterium]|nr:hypothetical protein [Pseudomonadota bacterium]